MGIKRTSPRAAAVGSVQLIQSTTTTTAAMTVNAPDNRGSIFVAHTDGFPVSGTVRIGNEVISYTGKSATSLNNITRLGPTYNMASGTTVSLLNNVTTTPYLASIQTPAKKTAFTHEWWTFDGRIFPGKEEKGVVALHEIFECGRIEEFSEVPTYHFAWRSDNWPYHNIQK